jgi:hypothetical protein
MDGEEELCRSNSARSVLRIMITSLIVILAGFVFLYLDYNSYRTPPREENPRFKHLILSVVIGFIVGSLFRRLRGFEHVRENGGLVQNLHCVCRGADNGRGTGQIGLRS